MKINSLNLIMTLICMVGFWFCFFCFVFLFLFVSSSLGTVTMHVGTEQAASFICPWLGFGSMMGQRRKDQGIGIGSLVDLSRSMI